MRRKVMARMIPKHFSTFIPLLPVLFQHFYAFSAFITIKVAFRYQYSGSVDAISYFHFRDDFEPDAEAERRFEAAFARAEFPDFDVVGGEVVSPVVIFLT